jgi:filamentous hemagglutinin family protein
MNARSFKTVFSKRLGALLAVGEHATSQGKANGASGPGASGASEGAVSALAGIGYVAALSASFAFVSLAWAAPATNALPTNALPTGGTVVQGAVSMSQTANQLNIQQATQRAAINWQSFNIGAAASVNVAQPNAQAVLLNRVVGQSPSQIFGKLQANGHVILVNPNGVLFGKDGSVNAGGFTASTLNISDANFMVGNMVYERNGSTASIVNEGKISTEPGGYVALLGATVSNEGSITTKGGSVVMGAGETIKVPVSGTGRIKLELTPAAINASVSNSGSIVTEGGQVYMQALALNRAAAQILQSGSVHTTGEKGGDVHVLADGGRIRVSGSITANSNNGTAGGDIYIGRDKDTNVLAAVGDAGGAKLESKGGFVETSGDWLATYGTKVKAKDWLLDPYNINIVGAATGTGTPYVDPNVLGGSYTYTPGAASNIRNIDIQNSLNDGTNVKISTGLSGSAGGDVGNINVGANIAKTSGGDATLTLEANNRIIFGGFKITGSSTTGKLGVNLIAKGGDTPSATSGGVYVASGGGIDTNGKVVIDATSKYTGGWDFTKAALAMGAGSIIKGGDIDIKLNVDFNSSPTAYRVYGAFLQNNVTLEATAGNLSIDSKISTGSKSFSSNAITVGSNYGNASILKATGGNVSLTADWSGNTGGGGGINMVDTAVSATGNILVDSKVNSDGMSAIAAGNGGSGKGFSAVSTGNGDVTFTANKGAIGLGNLTTKIKGKDVTFNNGTGASGINTGVAISGQGIDAAGKIYIKGTALGSGAGVNVAGAYTTTGTSPNDTVYVEGTSATGDGVRIGTIGSLPSANQSVVTIKGTSLGGTGSGIAQTGAITAKSINMTGNSVGGAGVTGLGVLTATGNIDLEGNTTGASSSNNGLVINNTVTSTGGNITAKASAANTTKVALAISGSGALIARGTNKNINMVANTMDFSGATAINAGTTGTVNITTKDAATAIRIGVDDGFPVAARLSLNQTELNKITAEKTVIGDSLNTGGIALDNVAVTTNASTGNITLLTAGSIAVNTALTVGGTNNLTLNGAGANSAITQTAAIKAAGLELLGANATHTLTNAGNDIKKLAGETKTVSLTNNANFAIDTVNTVGLTTSGNTTLNSTYSVTQNQAIKAAGLELLGANGSYTLTNTGNDIKKLAGNTGTVSLTNNQAFAIDTVNTVGLTTSGNTTLNSTKAVTQASGANIKAAGLELLGANGSYTLNNSGNAVQKLAGNTGTVSLTNQGNLTVDVVNGTTGLTAANDIKLTTTTATGTALTIANKIESTAGNVTINATTSDTSDLSPPLAAVKSSAEVKGKDITMNAVALSNTGKTLGYYGTPTGKFTASKELTLIASTQNTGSGFYMYEGALAAGNALTIEGTSAKGQGVGFDKATTSPNVNIASGNGLTIKGTASNSTSTAPQAAINLKDVDLTNSAGAVTLEAVKGDITTGGTGTLTQNGNVDVKLTTVDHGNIFVPQIINKGTGNVVIAAGSDLLAGNGSGGQVKTVSGNTISQDNATPGNTFLYSGSAANTGLLNRLDNSFSELRLSGDMGAPGTPLAQNADSNVKYAAGTTITGGAKAQVMFREKIALDTSTINSAALSKTYGGENTKSSEQTALFAEMQAQLKQTNPGQIITRSLDGTNGAGEFKISKATLINDFSGSLNTDATSFSTSTHLTAKTHKYGALSSTKYDATLAAGAAKVEVAKLALTGSITQSNSIYGDSLVAGTASFTNKVGSDVVNPVGVNIVTAGNTSGSGNLNAGTHAGIQSVRGLTGDDSANYSFANVKGDYKVDKRPLTIAPGSVATKTADGNTTAVVIPGTLSNLVGTETLGVAATGTFSDANAGNNKAVNAFYTLQNGANGGVASNYILALGKPGNPDTRMTGTILASVNPVTPIAPVNNNTSSVSRVRTVSGFGGAGAATGVLDDTPVTESREVCSDVFPENCECQPSVIPSIEICFAPKSVAATKEEK